MEIKIYVIIIWIVFIVKGVGKFVYLESGRGYKKEYDLILRFFIV